jgi:hypothetical protein
MTNELKWTGMKETWSSKRRVLKVAVWIIRHQFSERNENTDILELFRIVAVGK